MICIFGRLTQLRFLDGLWVIAILSFWNLVAGEKLHTG